MDAEREFELKCELRSDADSALPVHYWIDPNQFDGDDTASEAAAKDTSVDVLHDELIDAQTAADRLAQSVGHRVVVQSITQTSSYGREYANQYVARPCPIRGVRQDLAEIFGA